MTKEKIKSLLTHPLFKETSLYAFFGVAVTVVNLGLYHLFVLVLDYKTANLLALGFSKTFAYFVNKVFVFKAKSANSKEMTAEILRFIGTSIFTALIDFTGLIFLVDYIGFNKYIGKYIMTLFIIVLNYVLRKMYVFKKREG
ncbi:putative flippase GtrA [Elusimicrobium posterum]|uniref:GtrA family protein n=1 Tax=Elusimicrobium posterum TaxID=3116653 RepID=UPI003C710435